LSLVSAVLQFFGTALIVWGLKVTSNPFALTFVRDRRPGEAEPPRAAGIVREHRWAVSAGVWLLLAGLALAVVVTALSR
jgi:hypothetical protein